MNNIAPVSAAELNAFVAALSAKLSADSRAEYPTCEANHREAVLSPGGLKYARVVAQCPIKDDQGRNIHAGAYCFIDLGTGDILRCDGWKKPAKHPRGNIRLGDAANWWNGALTRYGAAYLR